MGLDSRFTVLMSVYAKEDPEFFRAALVSIANGSCVPDEVVIVCDGPLTDFLFLVIDDFKKILNIVEVKLERNVGLGSALNLGLKFCSNKIVARCDSDDINRSNRFETQLNFFSRDPDLKILSGWVEEFDLVPGDLGCVRYTPPCNAIGDYAKRRNPFNHPCIMFNKDAVIASGGYRCEHLYEDYALWARMIVSGFKADNVQDVLVDMRVGSGMYARRGGLKYLVSEFKAQLYFYRIGLFGFWWLICNLLVRLPVRIFPNFARTFVYKCLLR